MGTVEYKTPMGTNVSLEMEYIGHRTRCDVLGIDDGDRNDNYCRVYVRSNGNSIEFAFWNSLNTADRVKAVEDKETILDAFLCYIDDAIVAINDEYDEVMNPDWDFESRSKFRNAIDAAYDNLVSIGLNEDEIFAIANDLAQR